MLLSSYRLGDLVLLGLREDEQEDILRENPNSIGSVYILEKRKNKEVNNIHLITSIVLTLLEQISEVLPKDISESTVIHLRLGDVVGGNESHEKMKRPFDVNYIKTLLEGNNDTKYVIGNCHYSRASSTNYEECTVLSNNYLRNVMDSLNAHHYDSGDADIDLCCAVKSKRFLKGQGGYSELIYKIRKALNLENIELR